MPWKDPARKQAQRVTYRASHAAQGLCIRCPEPKSPKSRTLCAMCLAASRAEVQARAEAKRARGECRYCDRAVDERSIIYCPAHLALNRQRTAESRARAVR
jgi:hypothetical protein